jgi:hypothetical protein
MAGPDPLPPIDYPSWLGQPLGQGAEGAAPAAPPRTPEELAARLAELKRVDDPKRVQESRERDQKFLERKEANERLLELPGRLDADLAAVGVTREQYDLMMEGDPRVPLGFESQAQLEEFKADIERALAGITVDGKPVTAVVQVMGTSTSFYSGNPDKAEGHHWDKKGIGKSDYDIDVISPELVKVMLQNPDAAANDVVLRNGERVIFKSSGPGGFFEAFPQFADLAREWKDKLGGRDVDFKLKMDLTPIDQLPPPPGSGGPIPLVRKG